MTTFFPSWDLRCRRHRCQKALVERLPGEVYSAPCSGPATGNLSADHVNVSRLQSHQSNASIFMLEYGCRLERLRLCRRSGGLGVRLSPPRKFIIVAAFQHGRESLCSGLLHLIHPGALRGERMMVLLCLVTLPHTRVGVCTSKGLGGPPPLCCRRE